MPSRRPERRRRELRLLGTTLLVAVLSWGIGQSTPFQVPEGWLYDLFISWSPSGGARRPQVMIVEASADDAADLATWDTVTASLRAAGARHIAFTAAPPGLSPRAIETLASGPDITIGQLALPVDARSHRWRLQHPPLGDAGRIAATLAPHPETTAVREQLLAISDGERTLPTLVARAAAQADADAGARYLIDFRTPLQRIPQIDLQRLLREGAVPELVDGRVVLIGGWEATEQLPVPTPLAVRGDAPRVIEVRALSIDTLLAGTPLHRLHPGMALLLSISFGLITLAVTSRLPTRLHGIASVTAVAIYPLAGWAALGSLALWLPTGQLLLNQIAVFGLLFRSKSLGEDRALRRLLLSLRGRLRDRVIPEAPEDADAYWGFVLNVVRQTLDLRRCLFLDRVPDDHRLHEIKALDCGLDEIEERRRDYERYPYTAALESGGLVQIDIKRPFLRRRDGEDQYLIALQFSGEVLGFWAFGVAPEVAASTPRFRLAVEQIAEQIGELLAYKNLHLTRLERGPTLAERLLPRGSDYALSSLFRQQLGLITSRMHMLEALVDNVSLATVVYDVFGRIIHANRQASEAFAGADLPIYSMTALDLLVALTGLEPAAARGHLRRVLLYATDVTLDATVGASPRPNHVLNLRPITTRGWADGAGSGGDEPAQLPQRGFLLELHHVSRLREDARARVQLCQRVVGETAEGLARAAARREGEPWELVQGAASHLGALLEALSRDAPAGAGTLRSVDLPLLLNATLGELRSQIERLGIEVLLKLDATAVVRAVPEDLAQLVRAGLALMIEDCRPGGEVQVTTRREDGGLLLELRNAGTGIPDEQLQAFLEAADADSTPELARLQALTARLAAWGASMDLWSELGEGYRLRMHLEPAV